MLNEEQKRQRFKASIFTRTKYDAVNSSFNLTLGQGVDLPREDPALDYQRRVMEQAMVLQDREMEQVLLHQNMKPEDWQQNKGTEEVTSIRVSVIKTTKRANPEEECRSNYIENFRHIFIYKTTNFHVNCVMSDLQTLYQNEDFRLQL